MTIYEDENSPVYRAEALEGRVDSLTRTVWVLATFVTFLVIAVVIAVPQVIASNNRSTDAANRSADAATKAASAARAAKAAAVKADRSYDCLINFGTVMVQALNRRQDDSIIYQNADAARDKTLVKLFRAKTPAEQKKWADQYLADTIAKQDALRTINEGRNEAKYPKPPEEVCP